MQFTEQFAPTVYIVDDDPQVQTTLGFLMESVNMRYEAFFSGQEFMTRGAPQLPGCLLLDVRMPGPSGPDVQEWLKTNCPDLPVIFISGHADVTIAVEAMKNGAFDFIPKPFNMESLLSRINRAIEKSRDNLREQYSRQTVASRLALLTDREREVLTLVLDGKPSKEVARILDISIRTAENHRTRVLQKLHLTSSVELVKFFAGLTPHEQAQLSATPR